MTDSISIEEGRVDGRTWARLGLAVGLGLGAEMFLRGAPAGWMHATFVAVLVTGSAILATRGRSLLSLGLGGLGVLALAVHPHWASATLALTGLVAVAISGQSNLIRDAWHWLRSAAYFTVTVPIAAVLPPDHAASTVSMPDLGGVGRRLRGWVVPVLLASGFLLLFLIGNPMMADWVAFGLNAVSVGGFADFLALIQSLFWVVVVSLLALPFLKPSLLSVAESGPDIGRSRFTVPTLVRTLVLCNLLFLAQNALDLAYLWGGAGLPEGMTYARFAHRGVYPLAFAASLVGALVLLTMPAGGAAEKSPLARSLVVLWLAQTALLTLSCLKRLDLYVSAYSLTYMRVAAIVATLGIGLGLLLILARIVQRRSNGWLLARATLVGFAMVFACSVIDIGARIAWFNVNHSTEMGGEGVRLDTRYLEHQVGASAIPALATFAREVDTGLRARQAQERLTVAFTTRMEDHRTWTIRRWLLSREIASLKQTQR